MVQSDRPPAGGSAIVPQLGAQRSSLALGSPWWSDRPGAQGHSRTGWSPWGRQGCQLPPPGCWPPSPIAQEAEFSWKTGGSVYFWFKWAELRKGIIWGRSRELLFSIMLPKISVRIASSAESARARGSPSLWSAGRESRQDAGRLRMGWGRGMGGQAHRLIP